MRARTIVMLEIPEDKGDRHRLFKAIDDSFKVGDFEGCGTSAPGYGGLPW